MVRAKAEDVAPVTLEARPAPRRKGLSSYRSGGNARPKGGAPLRDRLPSAAALSSPVCPCRQRKSPETLAARPRRPLSTAAASCGRSNHPTSSLWPPRLTSSNAAPHRGCFAGGSGVLNRRPLVAAASPRGSSSSSSYAHGVAHALRLRDDSGIAGGHKCCRRSLRTSRLGAGKASLTTGGAAPLRRLHNGSASAKPLKCRWRSLRTWPSAATLVGRLLEVAVDGIILRPSTMVSWRERTACDIGATRQTGPARPWASQEPPTISSSLSDPWLSESTSAMGCARRRPSSKELTTLRAWSEGPAPCS
mmetsp:Transcript_134269/g.388680  ORF Transcript_134269/g.388680 Transcript_134269/m.388680 type:complete len:306 (-) Transcript_134269:56-973(-)